MIRTREGERRQSPRRAIEVNTTLVYKDLSISQCRTRDIGFGGAFIYTPNTAPPKNANVSMLLIQTNKIKPIVLESTVLDSTNEGAAIEFRSISNEANNELIDLVFSWQRAAIAMPTTQTTQTTQDRRLPGHDLWWR